MYTMELNAIHTCECGNYFFCLETFLVVGFFVIFFSSYLTLVYRMDVSIDIAHDKVYIRPSCHLNYGCSISYITKTGIHSVGKTPLNPLGPYQIWNGDSI